MPFIIGLIIGIAVITNLCKAYQDSYKWIRWIPNVAIADATLNLAGSNLVQEAYERTPQWLKAITPFDTFLTVARYRVQLAELCPSQPGFLEGLLGSTGGIIRCPDGTLSVVARSSTTIALINQNMDVYKQAAAATNVPWELLAAVHYREGSNNPNQSLGSGERVGSVNPDQHRVVGNNLYETAVFAGEHLQEKAGGRLTQDITDEAIIKDALWGYNGRAYKAQAARMGFSEGYEGSPYVMNNFDERHRNMGIITRDHGPIDGTDSRDGAFTVFALLRNGTFDDNGLILALGDCVRTEPSGVLGYVGGIIEQAKSYIGRITKYSMGRRTDFAGGYADCSSFVSKVLQDIGVPTPILATSSMSSRWDGGDDPYVKPVLLTKRVLTQAEMAQIQPGDIIIWGDAHSTRGAHTAIITGTDAERFYYVDVTSSGSGGAQERSRSRGYRSVWGVYRVVDTQ